MRRLACLLIIGLSGCVGLLGGDEDGESGTTPAGGESVDVAWAPIRRMTPEQYENSVRDLVGDAELTLDLDEDSGEFFTRLGAEKLNLAVEQVVSRQDLWQEEVFPCDTSGAEDLACVDLFIETFGYRAFRRPLEAEEQTWLRSHYDAARGELGFRDAMNVVFSVILQSPQFIYFPEFGRAPIAENVAEGVRPLTSYERASRLSFFLLNSVPDAELLLAAEAGLLDTREGVHEQTTRLLAKPKARALFRSFVTDLMGLDGNAQHTSLEASPRDAALFPLDSPSLRSAMRSEIEALVDRVVVEQEGSFAELLTTREALVDDDLAALYGVTKSGASDWVTLPAERSGLLTRAAFLTMYSRGDVKSPIRRGAYILDHLLCMQLGAPPPNANDVPITGGSVDENGQVVRRTVRQDAEAKTSGEGCTHCHELINPPGFAFENFDALGQYVTVEAGSDADGSYELPIDASGGLPLPSGELVEVSSAVALSEALASSTAFSDCVAEHWFAVATRRTPAEADERTLESLREALADGRPFLEVVYETVESDAFLFMKEESAQ